MACVFTQVLRFRCLLIILDALRFVKGFTDDFFVFLKTHPFRAPADSTHEITTRVLVSWGKNRWSEEFRGATLAWHKNKLDRSTCWGDCRVRRLA